MLKQIEELDLSADTDLTTEQIAIVHQLLRDNIDVFAVNPKVPPINTQVKHHIVTEEVLPIKQRGYTSSHHEEDIIRKEVAVLLANKIIRKSNSPWSAPVVLALKKDGSYRFCVDYRRLNQVTKKDVYPLPRIDTLLEKLRGKRFYSTFDLASGYWHVEVFENDKEKTAFVCPQGLYEFNRTHLDLPMHPLRFKTGKLAAVTWMMCLLLQLLLKDIHDVSAYFQQLRNANMALKLSKCSFFRNKITYLGHVVSEKGISPDLAKVTVIKNLKPPSNVRELRHFLGVTGYYRKFIRDYSVIAHTLSNLLYKSVSYQWTDQCHQAFEALRDSLCSYPILCFAESNLPYVVYTDACKGGFGAVLSQVDPNNEEYVVQYASCALTSNTERRSAITELEARALVWGIRKFPQEFASKNTSLSSQIIRHFCGSSILLELKRTILIF